MIAQGNPHFIHPGIVAREVFTDFLMFFHAIGFAALHLYNEPVNRLFQGGDTYIKLVPIIIRFPAIFKLIEQFRRKGRSYILLFHRADDRFEAYKNPSALAYIHLTVELKVKNFAAYLWARKTPALLYLMECSPAYADHLADAGSCYRFFNNWLVVHGIYWNL